MKKTLAVIVVFASILLMGLPLRKRVVSIAKLQRDIERVRPLHEKISEPGPGDWLANHKEPGQTFKQYVESRPVTPQGKRNVLYIQPIGTFSPTQQKIVKLTAEYMETFFSI